MDHTRKGDGMMFTDEEFARLKKVVEGHHRGEPYRGEFAPNEEAREACIEAFREAEAEAARRKAASRFNVIDGGRE